MGVAQCFPLTFDEGRTAQAGRIFAALRKERKAGDTHSPRTPTSIETV